MELWIDLGEAVVRGIPSLFVNPFTYVILIIMFLLYRRTLIVQRKLFGSRLLTVAEGWSLTLFSGLCAGALLSVVMLVLGVMIAFETFLLLFTIALILSFLHIRFFQLHYAAALLALFTLCTPWVREWSGTDASFFLWQIMDNIDLPSLFAFVALLSLAGGWLISAEGWKRGTPVFIEGKRGRLVGGYRTAVIWFIPVFALGDSWVMGMGGSGAEGSLVSLYDAWPLFAAYVGGTGLFCLLLPAFFFYMNTSLTTVPRHKSRRWAKMLTVYGCILLIFSVISIYVSVFMYVTLVYMLIGYEVLALWSRWSEQKSSPLYVHTAQGLKILAVVPGSPAERMGLESGEIIHKLNGQALLKRKDFFEALRLNQAFCKLEVLNLQGEQKFVQCSLYEHEQHHLGILLAPDEHISAYLPRQRLTLFRLLGQQVQQRQTRAVQSEEHSHPQSAELSVQHPAQQSEQPVDKS